jgi:uncharacterized membrane protein
MHIIRPLCAGPAAMNGQEAGRGSAGDTLERAAICETPSMADPVRCWMIKRNCSASPMQLAWIFASIVAVSFVFGAVFAAHGLWLVLPFVGIETLAVAAAFFCYGRVAADYERIEIGGGEIAVEKQEGRQRTVRRLPVAWATVELQRRGEQVSVWVRVGAERIEVGRHLLDARRARLAGELQAALAGRAPA